MLQTKDALFECLAAQDGFISGELLAERLGVSRSAVWKAVGELRAEGCRIEAAQNRGYALRDPGSRLSAGRIQALLRGRAADCRVLVERTVDSTNDELKRRAAAGCPTGTVLVAERQTGGKGRLGRSFYSPPRGGLYMSLLLRPALPASECMAVTACTAVAVAAAAEQICGRRAEIKWVNDIMMDGKKLCGILTEGALSAETGLFDYLVVGIGVNVASAGFPEELREVGDVDVRRRRESAARPGGGGDSQSAVREVRDASAADVYGRIPRAELRHRAGNHDDGFFRRRRTGHGPRARRRRRRRAGCGDGVRRAHAAFGRGLGARKKIEGGTI